MKTYRVTTEPYRELLQSCRAELRLLGYSAGVVRLSGAEEFLRRMEAAGRVTLAAINKEDIAAHLVHLYERPNDRRGGALSEYTVLGYVYSLRLLFDYAERHGLLGGKGSPVAGLGRLARPRAQRRRYCCDREQIAALYAVCADDTRRRAVLHLLYGCGLRRSEAVALDVGDIDYRAGLLYVRRGKGRKRRVVPIGERLVGELRAYHAGERQTYTTENSSAAYLLNDRGGRMRGGTLARHVRKMVAAAGLDARITPHVLRHSIATHLLAGGMAVERVRDFLGHERLETTQGYTHVGTKTSGSC